MNRTLSIHAPLPAAPCHETCGTQKRSSRKRGTPHFEPNFLIRNREYSALGFISLTRRCKFDSCPLHHQNRDLRAGEQRTIRTTGAERLSLFQLKDEPEGK